MKNEISDIDRSPLELKKITLSALIGKISASEKVELLRRSLAVRQKTTVSGVRGSLLSIIVAELFKASAAPALVVMNDEALEILEADLPALVGENSVSDYVIGASLTLSSLASGNKKIVLTTPAELCKKVLPKHQADAKRLLVEKNAAVGYDRFQEFLTKSGFVRKEFVEDEGDFAVRGSIVDVFSIGALKPVRLEFFGDDVESIRVFDINTQLSDMPIEQVEILSNFADLSDRAESILSYLPPESLVITGVFGESDFGEGDKEYFDPEEILTKLSGFKQLQFLPLTTGDVNFGSNAQTKFNSNFSHFGEALQKDARENRMSIFATKSPRELKDIAEFLNAEDDLAAEQDAASSSDLDARMTTFEPEISAPDFLTLHTLAENFYEGFVFESVSLYAESDVFGKLHAHKRRRKKKKKQISLRELRSLKIGDYIVHEDYGIGLFMGLEKVKVGDAWQESVLIHYERGDKLYVNLQNLRLLSKYSSGEGKAAALSKLGSERWQQQKERVKKRLKEMARNLIELYAKRKSTKGFAFGEDSVWMREFESSFIFDETPDQETAIEAIKADMQSDAPMDRLVCGDAGFGKTEVAMRAAFKAVEASKQVAVLVPTTILAHQHFRTFKNRFQNFPTRIEVLSRFVPKAEQKRIVEDIQKGVVDIVIGTHRIVSKDVKFKDLGLFIIDEEQHFGVAAKEKLREEFPTVDTLTLTATPIPRTLQFSMMGARDLSIISTPPKNRQPIETIVHEFDADLIKQVIERELSRNGQVFFLHNRINTIEQIYDLCKRLCPKARIRIAHAQLPTKELESVMMDFLDKEIDVLITTTIVESGLDISNVNTIIINRADAFGLSDLYQLRGRVGRSERKAFCYLLTPPLSTLSEDALQRLSAIEEFTELGSGFNVAMRDLDIRGAGNLLGSEQSGFIYDLGFDLYQKILEEAVQELKSTEFQNIFKDAAARKEQPTKPCEVTFFFNALIPSHYVESASERFALYERLSKATSEAEVAKWESDLIDRFGKLPEECRDLIAVSRLRIAATKLRIARIEITEKKCSMIFPDGTDKEFYESARFGAVLEAVQGNRLKNFSPVFKNDKRLKLDFTFPHNYNGQPKRALDAVKEILDNIAP